jgi:hypothetical protein
LESEAEGEVEEEVERLKQLTRPAVSDVTYTSVLPSGLWRTVSRRRELSLLPPTCWNQSRSFFDDA